MDMIFVTIIAAALGTDIHVWFFIVKNTIIALPEITYNNDDYGY